MRLPLLFVVLASIATGQEPPDSVTVALAPEFEHEWPYGIVFGGEQQALWTTTLRLPRIDPATYDGGLTAIRDIVDPDVRLLVLRTGGGDTLVFAPLRERVTDIDADPRDRRLLPSHPSSALVADELAGIVGLFRTRPRLVWMSDDSLLGAFREAYGGIPGFLISLSIFEGHSRTFPVATDVLFAALDDDSKNTADAHAYLRARFLDLLAGEWERSPWKWRWLRLTSADRSLFVPIPSLRRQSLLTLGFFPSLLHGFLTPGFVNFTPEMGGIPGAVATGAALDTRILAPVSRETWDGITSSFIAALSDSSIAATVTRLPPSHHSIEGERITATLRSRRDGFRAASEAFYLHLAHYPHITLSNRSEYVRATRREDGSVTVEAWQRQSVPIRVFHRDFLPEETNEIRIYCLGGNDTVMVSGDASRSIVVRVEGGAGDDILRDSSTVRGPALGFIPWISSIQTMTYFYDHEGINDMSERSGTSVISTPASEYVPRGKFF